MSSIAPTADRDDESAWVRRVRQAASLLPMLLIGYSLLVDPLINYGGETSLDYQGFALETREKSTELTRFVMPALLAAALVLAIASPIAWQARQRVTSAWLAVFLGLAVMSSLWAHSADITLTLALYQAIICLTLALAVATSRDPERIFSALFGMFVLVVAVNLFVVATRPPGPVGHAGIYPYKNTLGDSAACALLFALYFVAKGSPFVRLVALVTALGAVYLLYASESKTAIVLAVASPLLAVALYGVQRFSRIPLVVLMLLGAATLAALFVLAGQAVNFRGGDALLLLFGDDNFTGRTHVWSFASSHIADRPLLGHGFRGFWGIGPDSPKLRAEIEFIRITGSAHNGFVDNMLDLGAVGLAVCLAYILSIFQAIQRLTVRPGGLTVFYLTVVFFVIGRNMMESVILWSTFFDNLLFVLVGFLAGQDHRRAAQTAFASSPKMSRAIPIPGPTDGAMEPAYRHREVKP